MQKNCLNHLKNKINGVEQLLIKSASCFENNGSSIHSTINNRHEQINCNEQEQEVHDDQTQGKRKETECNKDNQSEMVIN